MLNYSGATKKSQRTPLKYVWGRRGGQKTQKKGPKMRFFKNFKGQRPPTDPIYVYIYIIYIYYIYIIYIYIIYNYKQVIRKSLEKEQKKFLKWKLKDCLQAPE